jgi:hypothetical protein
MEQGMIVYHPFDDVYHCFSRILLIVYRLPVKEYDLKTIQILDFYFLFPGLLKKIRLPNESKIYRPYINGLRDSYCMVNNIKSAIRHLEHQINDVIHYMAAYELINIEKIKENKVLPINKKNYEQLINKLDKYDNDLLDFLVNILAKIPLEGKDGLKSRTGLFEYRYDNE